MSLFQEKKRKEKREEKSLKENLEAKPGCYFHIDIIFKAYMEGGKSSLSGL